jgi:hypothetical protein
MNTSIQSPTPGRSGPLRRARRRRLEAAYTAVEILMALAVMAVGVVGIIATEKVTLASNMHAKNLAIATRIGEGWLGMLGAEAALWGPSVDSAPLLLGRTSWLSQGAATTGWFRPGYVDALSFGPAFDALGNPVTDQNQDPNARFCVDLRVSQLTSVNTGGGMMRAEVRVFWVRDQAILGGSAVAPAHACSFAAVSMDTADNSRLFHFVHLSTAVRQVGI